jgi:GTP-binding protein Era
VGKSTLLNALLGEHIAIVSHHPQTTRESVRGVLSVADTQYVFVDTPGVHPARTRLGERMNESARAEAHEADVLVLVAETRLGEADLALARELPALPTILCLNKVDRLQDKALLLPILASIGEAGHAYAAVVPLSAKRKDGLDRLLKELRALLPEQPFLYEPDTLSDQPVRFFVAEFVREQILRHTKQEVPHGVAVVVERFDEPAPAGSPGASKKDVVQIEVAIHVVREAHKRILIGAQGRMMKDIGVAARARVEQMLGRQVHLKLWVRATPDWMNDPAKLRELGYGDQHE